MTDQNGASTGRFNGVDADSLGLFGAEDIDELTGKWGPARFAIDSLDRRYGLEVELAARRPEGFGFRRAAAMAGIGGRRAGF